MVCFSFFLLFESYGLFMFLLSDKVMVFYFIFIFAFAKVVVFFLLFEKVMVFFVAFGKGYGIFLL